MKEKTNSMKGLKEAAERILKAITQREKIILFGDADMDGVASVIILEETIKILKKQSGPEITVYFPDREKEGYGINKSALNFLKDKAPALFISLDCGIGNVREVKFANKLGFEVIIVDHHEVLFKLPCASVIVNPKQKDDNYPFKRLACAAIAYKLARLLFLQAAQEWRPEEFLVLAMLATLSDQVPLKDENKQLVKQGMLALNYTKRPGLRALMKIFSFENLGIEEIFHTLLHPLGSAGTENHLNEAYLFLTETSLKKTKERAEFLIEKSKEKRIEIKRIFEEVQSRVNDKEAIIFEGDEGWPVALLGPVASRICQEFKKPTFIFKKHKTESQGSVRTPHGLNAVKAMASCRQFLKTYGGHAPAAGFRVKNENLKNFKKCLIEYFRE